MERSGAGTSPSVACVSSSTRVCTIAPRAYRARGFIPRMRDARRRPKTDRVKVPAAAIQRRLLVVISIALYGAVFTSFVLFEVPGLGLGHFFYIPVALLALATGM